MGAAKLPTALPDASTVLSSQTLLAADLADNQDTDRNELRALAGMVGLGTKTPARGKVMMGAASGSVWDGIARKNLVTNYDCRIAQRNVSGVITPAPADNGYGIDRWRLLLEAANAAVVTQETSNVPSYGSKTAAKLTAGSGNNNKFGHFQVFEAADCTHLRGQKVSLQASLEATAGIANVKMAILEWTGTADAVSGDPISAWGADGVTPTLTANWAFLNTPANLSVTTSDAIKYVEDISVGAGANNLAVFIWSDDKTTTTTTDFLIITDVQLEQGSVCTSIERRPLPLEWVACRWWLRRVGSFLNCGIANGYVNSATQVLLNLFFERLRASPTTTFATATNFTISSAVGSPVLTNIAASAPSPVSIGITATLAAASFTTPFGQGCYMYANATAGYFDLSAEL